MSRNPFLGGGSGTEMGSRGQELYKPHTSTGLLKPSACLQTPPKAFVTLSPPPKAKSLGICPRKSEPRNVPHVNHPIILLGWAERRNIPKYDSAFEAWIFLWSQELKMYNEKIRKYSKVLFLTLAPFFLIFFFFSFLVYILWLPGSNSGALQSGGGKKLWLARLTRTATKNRTPTWQKPRCFPANTGPLMAQKPRQRGLSMWLDLFIFQHRRELKTGTWITTKRQFWVN